MLRLHRWLLSLPVRPRRVGRLIRHVHRPIRPSLHSLEDRLVPNGELPAVANLHLRADTGASSTDGLTWDPTVLGSVVNDDGYASVGVEFDRDGDFAPDGRVVVAENGTFEFSEYWLSPGPISYRFRASEWDTGSGQRVTGPWTDTAFGFTYELPPNTMPTVGSLALYRDTGAPGDAVTFDPTIRGTVADDGGAAGLRVEIDTTGDGSPDGYTIAAGDGSFEYTPVAGAGSVTVRARAWDWDEAQAGYRPGNWSGPLTLQLTAPPDASVGPLTLVHDSGVVGDYATFDPRVAGVVAVSGGGNAAGLTVSFDFNGDDKVDAQQITGPGGAFDVTPPGPIGGISVRARYEEWDYTTGQRKTSAWSSITFTRTAVPPAVVSGWKLKNDTGLSNADGVTSDATLVGTVTFEDGAAGRQVEIDWTGDDESDAVVVTNGSGEFEVEPFDLGMGKHTAKARALVWDWQAGNNVVGDWASLSFTLEAPLVRPPDVTVFRLFHDDGSSNTDGLSTDPTLTGKLVNPDGSADGLLVDIDYDGDGVAEGTAVANADGVFTYYPIGLAIGPHAIHARGNAWDGNKGVYVAGAWSDLTFTFVSPTNTPAHVTELKLKDDTGPSSTDGITTDPMLTGTALNADGDAAYLAVEFDEDGDGKGDGFAYADYQGKFEYRPRRLNPGGVTVKARAVEFDPISNGYVYGDWATVQFTLEQDTTGSGTVPTAGNALAATVGQAALAMNAATGLSGGSAGFDFGIGRYDGAQGVGSSPTPANSVPITIYATNGTVPATTSSGGTLVIDQTSGPFQLSLNGSFSYSVAVSGDTFVVDAKTSFSYAYDQTTITGTITSTIHQKGTYSFSLHLSATFSVDGGVVTITGGHYDTSESSTTDSTFSSTDNYSRSSGGLSVSGSASMSSSGDSYADRTEHGVFFTNPAGATVNTDYTTKGGGLSSGTYSDTGSYAFADPRGTGAGSITESGSFADKLDYTEKGTFHSSGGSTTVEGSSVLDSTSSRTDNSNYSGVYAYARDGVSSAGTFALVAGFDYHLTTFHYTGSFSADAAGLKTDGHYTKHGDYTTGVTYGDKGAFAVSQTGRTEAGTFSTDLTANSKVTFEEGMDYVSTPTSVGVDGDYQYEEIEHVGLTNAVTNTYTITAGGETRSGSYLANQTSTDDRTSKYMGMYTAVGSTYVAEGLYSVDDKTTASLVISQSGSWSRTNHSGTFGLDETQTGTGWNKQDGGYHVSNTTNKATGTFRVESTTQVDSEWSGTTADTDVRVGVTNTTNTSSSGKSSGSIADAEWGSFYGESSDTTWAGNYDNKSSLDSSGKYGVTSTYSGSLEGGTVTANSDWTAGFTKASAGTYTKSSAGTALDGTFDNADSQTTNGTAASSGWYVNGPYSGWFTHSESTTSDYSYADKGSVSIAPDGTTDVTGSFDKHEAGTNVYSESTFDLVNLNSGGRVTSTIMQTGKSGNSSTTLSDSGSYVAKNRVLVSSTGTLTQTLLLDSWVATNGYSQYSTASPGSLLVGNGWSGSDSTANIDNASTIQYTRTASAVQLSGSAHDKRSNFTLSTGADDTHTFDLFGTAQTITETSVTKFSTYRNSSDDDAYTFTSAGSYAGYTGPSYPGAGTYVEGPREQSGSRATSNYAMTNVTDDRSRNSPTWSDDGSVVVTGSVYYNETALSVAAGTETFTYASGAAGNSRQGSFTLSSYSLVTDVYGSDKTEKNYLRTHHGTRHSTLTGSAQKHDESSDSGTFAESFPTTGGASTSRAGHVYVASWSTGDWTSTVSLDDTSVESDDQWFLHSRTQWREDGSTVTTAHSTRVEFDSADYVSGTGTNSRTGRYVSTATESMESNTKWFSSGVEWGDNAYAAAPGGNTLGIYDEYEFGTGYTGMMYPSGTTFQPEPGARTDRSASQSEVGHERQWTYATETIDYQSTSGGPAGPSTDLTGTGTYQKKSYKEEKYDTTDENRFASAGPTGHSEHTYRGEGHLFSTWRTPDDSGTVTIADGVKTSIGTRTVYEESVDKQKTFSTFNLDYDLIDESKDHHHGDGWGESTGSSTKYRSMNDVGAGYTVTVATNGGESATRNGGTVVVADDEKKAVESEFNYHEFLEETPESTSGVGSTERSGGGKSNASYTYVADTKTAYVGAVGTSKYTYYERAID